MTHEHAQQPTIPRLVISVTEAARAAGISAPEAYRRIKKGQFPLPVKITDKRRGIRVSDLTAWVEALPTAVPDATEFFVNARKEAKRTAGGEA